MKKRCKRILCAVLVLALAGIAALAGINGYMIAAVRDRIVSWEDIGTLAVGGHGEADCVLVLGAGVRPDGSPSDMLADRVETGLAVYHADKGARLLMSGDHGQADYDEVKCMLDLALADGVPAEDVFLDHAGFSTYESLYRAKEIFGADSVIIVTQGYHLPRALYIAEALGLDAAGVSADLRSYAGQFMRDIREALARAKDFVNLWFLPEPTYLGDPIDLSGDGRVTQET